MTAVSELPPDLDDPIARWREYLTEVTEEDGLFYATVSLEFVQAETVATDAKHVEEIQRAILETAEKQGGSGQLTRINVADIAGEPKLLISDGFHRDEAIRGLGRDTIKVTIQPNMTWEELIDQRILTASLHQSVKFERVIDWVEDAWARTPWADKLGASQAFALVCAAGMTGSRIGLTPDEAAEIRAWVSRKSEQWQLATITIYNHLSIAKIADPKLLDAVHQKGGKKSILTQQHLKAIAQTFPNDYESQQVAVDVVTAKKLNARNTRVLVEALGQGRNPGEMNSIAYYMKRDYDWSKTSGKKTTQRVFLGSPLQAPTFTFEGEVDEEAGSYIPEGERVSQERFTTHPVTAPGGLGPTKQEKELREIYIASEIELARAALEMAILRGRYIAVAPNAAIAGVPQISRDRLPPRWQDLVRPASAAAAVAKKLAERLSQMETTLPVQIGQKHGMSLADATKTFVAAKRRLSDDFEAGAMRFAPPAGAWHLERVLANTIDDQAERILEAKLPKVDDVHSRVTAVPRHAPVTESSVANLQAKIVKGGPMERRALILASLFHLPSYVIGQALRTETEHIDTLLAKSR